MIEHLKPIIAVTVRNPLHPNRRAQVDGLVDTGSDVSAIPVEVIQKLELINVEPMTLSGIDGIEASFKRYIVDLEIAGIHLERRSVIEWPGEMAVVGRDLLSEFTFFYDGKTRQFEIRDP